MQTNAGPVCDICGKYVLPWEMMTVVAFPYCKTPLLGHEACNLKESRLVRNWERGFRVMQQIGPTITEVQRAKLEHFLVKAYSRHSHTHEEKQ